MQFINLKKQYAGLHKKYFDLCAVKGVHTLVEKPLALSAKDAGIMYKTANDKNIILMVGHVERCNPEPEEIKAMGNIIYSDKYDFMQAVPRFKKGIYVSPTASRITETKKRTIEVQTKGAFISVDYIARLTYIYRRTNFKLDVGYRTKYSQENIVEKVFVPIKEP